MDGLVHGLIKVALGGEEEASDGGNKIESSSRSTWADVVSSGKDDDGHSSQWASRKEGSEGRRSDGEWKTVGHRKEEEGEEWKGSGHHSGQWASRKEESEGRSDGEWKNVGNRKSSNHHSEQWASRKEESEGGTDGEWETVGKKKQQPHSSRRQQKVPVDNWQSYKRPPSEQEYSDMHQGVVIEPSREEFDDLSKACSRLWELDLNRLVPGKDYEIDCGEGKKMYQKGDMASGSLFNWLNNDVFRRATYARFCCLLDNYNPNEGHKEVVTSEEKHEQAAFIEEISRTAPIRYVHKYLVAMGIAPEGYEEFKRMMTSLWFDLYGRGGGSSSSSAFEHVFVGEIKGRGENAVSGFHNWIQFYLEEAKGNVDYQGYIFPRRRGQCPDSETQLLTLQFEWNGVLKSLSSTLVGVSPEFEIALYTLCFFVGGEDNHIYLGPYAVNIKCYRLGRDKIGSVFPIADS